MTRELERRHQIELWISWIRLLAVPFAIVEVGLLSDGYPAGYERWAWITTGALAAGAGAIWLLARRDLGPRAQTALGYFALAFDIAIVGAFVVIFYAWEPNTPVRQALFLPVAEGAVRFGIAGGVIVPFLLAPFLAWGEALRADRFDRDFDLDAITFPLGLEVLMGLLVGWLAARLRREARVADERAAEAEELRDQLGRRADQLESVNRVSRALASSLEQDEAFDRFLRELGGVFEFERLAMLSFSLRAAASIPSTPAPCGPSCARSCRPWSAPGWTRAISTSARWRRASAPCGRWPRRCRPRSRARRASPAPWASAPARSSPRWRATAASPAGS